MYTFLEFEIDCLFPIKNNIILNRIIFYKFVKCDVRCAVRFMYFTNFCKLIDPFFNTFPKKNKIFYFDKLETFLKKAPLVRKNFS